MRAWSTLSQALLAGCVAKQSRAYVAINEAFSYPFHIAAFAMPSLLHKSWLAPDILGAGIVHRS